MALSDKQLEARIFEALRKLEWIIDAVGPTPVRHRLSELIVEMRETIWGFDQARYDAGELGRI